MNSLKGAFPPSCEQMCDGEGGCEGEADLHASELIGLPGVHRDRSHEADMDTEASVHAGALETEEDGEADWGDEEGRGREERGYLRPIADLGFCSRRRGCCGGRGAR
jgi:hypothetical protein